MFGFWHRVSSFWRNFVAGLVIIGVLVSLHQLPVVKSWEDWAVDTMIALNVKLKRMTGEHHDRPDLKFTFLEMGESSYRHEKWNEAYHVPRDKVLKLIEFAVTGKASMIIVDVDFSKQGIDLEADKALKDYLLNYPASAPQLILMRNMQIRLEDRDSRLGKFRESYLDDVERSNIHFAQPLFKRDKDKMIRNWILLKQGCYKERGAVLPSVQLLAYALLKDSLAGGKKNLLDLDDSLRGNQPSNCEKNEGSAHVKRPVVIGKIVFKQQRLGERLIYTMPWEKAGYTESSDLISYPAYFVTDGTGKGPSKAYDIVTDRITLIGASYGASHDLHLTPVDIMPGGLIILNAIKSLSLFDQITPPPLYVRLAFLLTFITILSFVFSRYNNFIKLLVVSALVFVFFVPISYWLFKYGVWFDFGILLLGIKLQHTASEFFEVRELKRLRSKMQEIESAHLLESDSSVRKVPLAAEIANGDEVEVSVRLKRHPDGSYVVKATPAGGGSAEFELDADALIANRDGFSLDLKRFNRS